MISCVRRYERDWGRALRAKIMAGSAALKREGYFMQRVGHMQNVTPPSS
jgi:hypothetical protein